MKKIQDGASLFFIVCTVILGAISVLGVWNIFGGDVITKSFETIGLLAGVAVIVIVASQFIDHRNEQHNLAVDAMGNAMSVAVDVPNPLFAEIRRATVAIVIVAAVLLAFIGILSIWEILASDVMSKSLSSLAIVGFDAFIIILTCLQREKSKLIGQANQPISGGAAILIGLGFLWLMTMFFR